MEPWPRPSLSTFLDSRTVVPPPSQAKGIQSPPEVSVKNFTGPSRSCHRSRTTVRPVPEKIKRLKIFETIALGKLIF